MVLPPGMSPWPITKEGVREVDKQCKKHQAATKKLEIYQAPDILVICLKRFGSSRRLTDKLDQLVSFPMEGLDLSDRIDERKIARSLDLNSEDMAHYGFQSGDEPMIYDLCESSRPLLMSHNPDLQTL